MNGEAEVACNHHDALAHRLIVKSLGLRRYRQLGCRKLAADRVGQLLFDGADAIERQRSADGDAELDEQNRAGRARPHPLHLNHARHLARDGSDVVAHPSRRRVRERVDGAATTIAAAASAQSWPSATPKSPISTAIDDHISDRKCNASASKASLAVAWATRRSVRARKKSMAIEPTMTTKAAMVASTACACAPMSRRTASKITMAVSTNKSAVSASAVTLSTLP